MERADERKKRGREVIRASTLPVVRIWRDRRGLRCQSRDRVSTRSHDVYARRLETGDVVKVLNMTKDFEADRYRWMEVQGGRHVVGNTHTTSYQVEGVCGRGSGPVKGNSEAM